jgi:signal transduction histidine kinase
MVLLASGEFRDVDDLPLRNWAVEDSRHRSGRADARVAQVEEELQALRDQFNDLAERVDFAERMLAQQRERPPLPHG